MENESVLVGNATLLVDKESELTNLLLLIFSIARAEPLPGPPPPGREGLWCVCRVASWIQCRCKAFLTCRDGSESAGGSIVGKRPWRRGARKASPPTPTPPHRLDTLHSN